MMRFVLEKAKNRLATKIDDAFLSVLDGDQLDEKGVPFDPETGEYLRKPTAGEKQSATKKARKVSNILQRS